MSTLATTHRRHALGLPAGSIRAAHTLSIVGLSCAMLLVPTQQVQPLPPYLTYLLLMVVAHYFAHRSDVVAGHHPLYLPRGLVRFIVMAALLGTIGWCFYSDPDRLKAQFDLSVDALKLEPFLPLCIVGAFFFGVIIRGVVGRENPPMALQDLEAWLSLLSIVGLCIAGIIHLIIMPTVETAISMPTWEAILASVIAFYFGERS
jgi:hypothetical protein